MNKLVHIDSEEANIYGTKNFNSFPPNWKQITVEQFAKSKFFVYSPKYIEHRQMFRGTHSATKTIHAKLFWFHDNTGIGMVHDYWKGKVYYYWFGCKHKRMKSWKAGRCYTKHECPTCGYKGATDSSD